MTCGLDVFGYGLDGIIVIEQRFTTEPVQMEIEYRIVIDYVINISKAKIPAITFTKICPLS